jgi:2-polyprenyl-3-methyl-5-hydroxy-6-metoxy-1,4-benzoquinol methylase
LLYSRRLVEELSALIGERECLEIAAGDGTLARFLEAEGVRITATDDHSWRRMSRCLLNSGGDPGVVQLA